MFLLGVFLALSGLGIDLFLMISASAGSDPSNWVGIAAVAQSLIVIGANLFLVGILAGVIESE